MLFLIPTAFLGTLLLLQIHRAETLAPKPISSVTLTLHRLGLAATMLLCVALLNPARFLINFSPFYSRLCSAFLIDLISCVLLTAAAVWIASWGLALFRKLHKRKKAPFFLKRKWALLSLGIHICFVFAIDVAAAVSDSCWISAVWQFYIMSAALTYSGVSLLAWRELSRFKEISNDSETNRELNWISGCVAVTAIGLLGIAAWEAFQAFERMALKCTDYSDFEDAKPLFLQDVFVDLLSIVLILCVSWLPIFPKVRTAEPEARALLLPQE